MPVAQDLAESLDRLLNYLDRRYEPVRKRALTARQWEAQLETDREDFRSLVMAVLFTYTGVEREQ